MPPMNPKTDVNLNTFTEMLFATGTVELIDRWTSELPEGVRLCSLCRLRGGVKESEWVQKIVRPIRELFWRYPEWKAYTSKVYIDKKDTESQRIAYAFRVDIEVTDVALALSMLQSAMKGSMPKPEAVVKSSIRYLDELPDPVIERPLVWSEGLMDRNVPTMKQSEYFHITGQQTKIGAGVTKI